MLGSKPQNSSLPERNHVISVQNTLIIISVQNTLIILVD